MLFAFKNTNEFPASRLKSWKRKEILAPLRKLHSFPPSSTCNSSGTRELNHHPVAIHQYFEMGANISNEKTKPPALKHSEAQLVKLMMPVYFSNDELTIEERKLAKYSWDLVANDKSPEFLSRRGKPDFQYQSCVTFFYDSFYVRLFDVHPMSQQLFVNGIKSQGKFLVKLIGMALSETENDDPAIFDRKLHLLTKVHFERGVQSGECKHFTKISFFAFQPY